MADESKSSNQLGLTPGKAVLIAVLAVTLGVVLYVQFGSGGGAERASSEAEQPADEGPTPTPPRRAKIGSTSEATSAGTAAARAGDASHETTAPPPLVDPQRWKAPAVETIVAHDPFALPPAFPQPAKLVGGKMLTSDAIVAEDAEKRANALADAVAKLQTELESLRSRGVSVIVRDRNEYVAMIGDRTVRVGEEINGFTVTAIEPDGVRVEKKVQE